MHLHILGICGTFMGGLAALAREAGHRVTGCDANVYPPMSDQLAALGIELIEGYDADQLKLAPDLFVVGNAITRGNPLMEAILDAGARLHQRPAVARRAVLAGRHVLAVAGTHGKTGTTSMLAWILEQAGLAAGLPGRRRAARTSASRRASARPSAPFVIEADEYDTAFFDKRSKFVHYRPRTAILNNLEFDHADIFDDLAAIERQFHHLVRTVPGRGRLVVNAREEALQRVLAMGCWSEVQRFGGRKEAPGHAARARRAARLRRAARRPEDRPRRVAAARRAQPAQRAGGDRPRPSTSASRPRSRRARWRAFATSGAGSSCAARPAASRSTTTSRTTRPRCARPSTACAARSARRASSPSSSRARTP